MSNYKNLEESILHSFINHQNQVAIIVNSLEGVNSKIIYFNKGAERLTGYRSIEVIDKPLLMILDKSAKNDLQDLPRKIAKENQGFSSIQKMFHKNGKSITVEIRVTPILNEQGEIIATMGVAIDLLKSHLYTGELAKSEEKFKSLFEESDDALSILDGEKFTDFNPSVLRMLGATKEEVLLTPPWQLSPKYQPDGQNSFEKAKIMIDMAWREGSHRFDWIHRRIDGTDFPVEVTLTPVKIGEKPVLYTVWRDISKRVVAEAKLKEIEEIFRVVTENSHDIIWIRDMNLKQTYLSPAVEKVKGYSVEHGMKLKIEDYVRPEYLPLIQGIIQREAENDHLPTSNPNRTVRFEVEELCADGTWIWTESVVSFIRDEEGIAIGILGITRDISQQKRFEEELKEAKTRAEESDQLKSAFVANMSHEIRTPMNSILGFSELISDDSLSAYERSKYINIIQSSSNQLMAIISDVIDISKIEAKQLKLIKSDIHLDSLFREIFEQYIPVFQKSSYQDISFNRDCLGDSCDKILYSDPNRIRQIIINLIDNAIKFTHEGEISFGCRPGKIDFIEVYVKDTGIGIPTDKTMRIFERFYQNKDGENIVSGTGLGLSICKSLIELMGGEIGVDSVEGEGSVFWFSLPLGRSD